uniref:alcohol dehydrogenase catalytic domain-containing protein n=1 Tax=Escherichia coli TaxID=562 RepID=UPI000A6E9F30
MKSILIEKPNQLSIIEREIPTPSAGEVRVKVKLAGICGSDSHIYRGHNPFAKYPRVIGHEFFGVIDAVGEGVESARVGERVAVDPVVSCGHCYPCSIGKPNVCTTLAVLGVHADGGFSEYAVVPAKNAWKIPEAIEEGEIFVIMGLSGSGKSTMVRLLNRLIEPTRGQVLIDGVDIAKISDAELREVRRKKIAMVFQSF